MLTKNTLRRAVAAAALVATAFAPALASAKTFVIPHVLEVSGTMLRVSSGSQYESVVINGGSVTVKLAAGQAFIISAPGPSPVVLENDASQPTCNVTVYRDNQLTLNGPITATVTPSTFRCDTSDYLDDRTPYLNVTQPSGGQTVKSGDKVQVFWTNSGASTASVRLSYSVDGGETAILVADDLVNEGFYEWTVPEIPSTTHARIRLDGKEQGRIVAFALSGNDFTIQGVAGAPAPQPEPSAPAEHPPYDAEAATAAAATIDLDRGFVQPSSQLGILTCVPGTRIKGTSSAAVYYCGQDGKRHAFPNQRIHDSWFQGFNGVVTLTDEQLAFAVLGKNVTYRPGVRMVKITTDPKVYAVDKGGVLRWVPDEWTAIRLYGDDWNKMIDDVPDSFFADYVIGEPVPTN